MKESKIEKIILHGSRARGIYSESSDIDLLVIINRKFNFKKFIKNMSYMIYEFLQETGIYIHLYPITLKRFNKGKDKKGENVIKKAKKEGIIL